MLRPASGISALNQCYQKAALEQGLWGQQLLNSGMEPEQLCVHPSVFELYGSVSVLLPESGTAEPHARVG